MRECLRMLGLSQQMYICFSLATHCNSFKDPFIFKTLQITGTTLSMRSHLGNLKMNREEQLIVHQSLNVRISDKAEKHRFQSQKAFWIYI